MLRCRFGASTGKFDPVSLELEGQGKKVKKKTGDGADCVFTVSLSLRVVGETLSCRTSRRSRFSTRS